MTRAPGTTGDRPRRRRAAVVVAPLLVLLAGLGLTTAGALAVRADGREAAHRASQQLATEEAADLAETVEQYGLAMRSLAEGVGAQPAVSDRVFQALAAPLDALPGVASLLYTVPVEPGEDEVAAAQERLRRQLGTALTLQPRDTELGEHRFVVSFRAVDTGGTALGADAAALPQVAAAATRARDTGSVTVSGAYVLLSDRSLPAELQQLSVVVIAPVVAGDDQADAGAFRGWVSAAFRTGAVLDGSTSRRTAGDARLRLWDVTDGPVELGAVDPSGPLDERSTTTAPLLAADRTWQLEVTPTRTMAVQASWMKPGRAATAGTLASLLLAGLTLSVTAGRARAENRVAEATDTLAAEVADRRTGEERLRTREAELSAYSTVVADRLRLPLAHLAEMSERAAARPWACEEDRQAHLADVARRLDAARRLVDDLLLYARAGELVLAARAVDLGSLATAVCAERLAAVQHLPEEQRPRFDVQPLPEVVGDPGLLRQLLTRLVDNAVVHAPPGQSASVRVSADLTGARFRGEEWRVEVRDRGLGVPPDRRGRVFEPFAGEDGDVLLESNHLSLALCRRVARRLGGELGLSDDPRGGSVFWFTLPVRSTAGVPAAGAVEPGGGAPALAAR
ncbi:sensor histidine kinase [Kineococcus terrestris]|uniref:sensor histidine kinase n=1 Tax=Kineococcus terrestris TaxID=2044856 RepID=UPI0034DB4ABC